MIYSNSDRQLVGFLGWVGANLIPVSVQQKLVWKSTSTSPSSGLEASYNSLQEQHLLFVMAIHGRKMAIPCFFRMQQMCKG